MTTSTAVAPPAEVTTYNQNEESFSENVIKSIYVNKKPVEMADTRLLLHGRRERDCHSYLNLYGVCLVGTPRPFASPLSNTSLFLFFFSMLVMYCLIKASNNK